ncbi:hypothetical protein [Duganella sp. HH101]|uniref:hypothetical protein n=1 Tax=Duganella sp. HH101 TaxID=1781066 RepID=UPI0008747C01|nr:hypothetical protein [Duganella sp. HH101]OFA01056.1 hypothetical protein DUGA2_43880 [Duganella sp. HH101]
MMTRRFATTAIALAFASLTTASAAYAADTACKVNCFEKRWVYFGGDITSVGTRQKLIDVIHRAAVLGYNGIALNTSGHSPYEAMLKPALDPSFISSFNEIVSAAKANGIELIPVSGGMHIPGYVKPQLIEAIPTTTPFIVKGGQATPVGASLLPAGGGSFESTDALWGIDATVSYDNSEAHTGSQSIKFAQPVSGGQARLYRAFRNLRKNAAYRMTYSVKAANYDTRFRIMITDDGGMPVYQNASADLGWSSVGGGWATDRNNLPLPSAGWANYNLDFNTGDSDIIKLYIGSWSASETRTGNVWIDDIDIKEIGLAHTIRRDPDLGPILPVEVYSKDRTIKYEEGVDYEVKVEKLTLPQTTKIKEGQELYVLWYQSAENMMTKTATPASACYPEYFNIQKQNFNNIRGLLGEANSSKYFIYYDENRVFNWDPTCPTKRESAGDYLAYNFKTYQDALLKEHPGLDLYVWHDMFDPNSNAIDKYWQVHGSLKDSHKGLNTTTTVVNWTDSMPGKQNPVASLTFFSKLSVKQIIAGYYDDSSSQMTEVKAWMDALDTAQQQGVTGVNGFMYTTFKGNDGYGDLEAVTRYLKERPGSRWPQ